MTTRILKTVSDDLHAWRVSLIKMRDEQGIDVGDHIDHIDAVIETIAGLQAGVANDKIAR